MNSFKYFKYILRTIGYQKYLMLIYPFFLVTIYHSTGMIVWMSLFILPTMATLPFMLADTYTSPKLCFTLPSKINAVVGGHYLYLSFVIIYSTVITFAGFFIFNTSESKQPITLLLYSLGVCAIVIYCSMIYPIFYKISAQHRNIVLIIAIFPMMLFAIGVTSLTEKIANYQTLYQQLLNHWTLIIIVAILISIVIAFLSYLLSIKICKNKDF